MATLRNICPRVGLLLLITNPQIDPNRRDVDVTNKPFLLDGEESLDGCARRQR
jgi:hypothetical protein